MISPAERTQRSAAGKASAAARRRRRQESTPHGDPNAPLPTTSDKDVDKAVADYVRLIGRPATWSDARIVEQMRAEIYRTRAAARADAIDRGQLFTRDAVRARDERCAKAYKDGLATINDLLAEILPPDALLAAQKRSREWVDEVLTRVADSIEAKP